MARKSDRELVSFRLDPDLAKRLREQASLQSISLTELANRLLHWAVQGVADGFPQGAAITSVPMQQSVPSGSEIRPIPVAYPQIAASTPGYHHQFPGMGAGGTVPFYATVPTSQSVKTEPPDDFPLSRSEIEELKREIRHLNEKMHEFEQSRGRIDENNVLLVGKR